MPADAFGRHIEPGLQTVLRRYTQALLSQIGRAVGCNAVHPIEARCGRWLLQTHDRVGSDEFLLSQEFLGQMLGVRRASVSDVAGALKEAATSDTPAAASPSSTVRASERGLASATATRAGSTNG